MLWQPRSIRGFARPRKLHAMGRMPSSGRQAPWLAPNRRTRRTADKECQATAIVSQSHSVTSSSHVQRCGRRRRIAESERVPTQCTEVVESSPHPFSRPASSAGQCPNGRTAGVIAREGGTCRSVLPCRSCWHADCGLCDAEWVCQVRPRRRVRCHLRDTTTISRTCGAGSRPDDIWPGTLRL